LGAAVGIALLAGCENYPPAEDVAACAEARFGTERGSFSVTQRPGSLFSATEYTITYQKAGSPDRAVVVYYQRKGNAGRDFLREPRGDRRRGAKVTESAGSHAIYVSRPDEVAAIIKKAAQP